MPQAQDKKEDERDDKKKDQYGQRWNEEKEVRPLELSPKKTVDLL